MNHFLPKVWKRCCDFLLLTHLFACWCLRHFPRNGSKDILYILVCCDEEKRFLLRRKSLPRWGTFSHHSIPLDNLLWLYIRKNVIIEEKRKGKSEIFLEITQWKKVWEDAGDGGRSSDLRETQMEVPALLETATNFNGVNIWSKSLDKV